MNQSFWVTFIFSAVLLTACGKTKFQVSLDNPSKEKVSVSIDGKPYDVMANEAVDVELDEGKHALDANGNKTDFTVSGEGMLNVTGAEYVMWKDVYFDRKKMDDYPAEALKEDSILLDGEKYYGDLTAYDKKNTFIEKVWDYGISTPFPDTIPLVTASYITKKKLFRKEAFVKEYNEMNGMTPELQHLMDSILNKTGDLKVPGIDKK